MSTTVYKFVLRGEARDLPHVFCSSSISGPAMLTYRLNERTTCETPIFVFINVHDAIEHYRTDTHIESRYHFTILEGYSNTKPFKIQTLKNTLPMPTDNAEYQSVFKFWKYNSPLLGSLLIDVKSNWYGVYDFTPLHEIL